MRKKFIDICSKQVPIYSLNRHMIETPYGAIGYKYISVKEIPDPDFNIAPYAKEVQKIIEDSNSIKNNKYLLVTENEKNAIKAAIMMTIGRKSTKNSIDVNEQMSKSDIFSNDNVDDQDIYYDEDDYYFGDEDLDEEFLDRDCDHNIENMNVNGQIILGVFDARDYLEVKINNAIATAEKALINTEMFPGVMFLGIDSISNVHDFTEAVLHCNREKVFVHIPKDREKDIEIQKLIFEMGFKILYLPENSDQYYEDFIESLLYKSDFDFESSIKIQRFLGACKNRWGIDFSEEYISKVLDYASENAKKEERSVFIDTDFEPLITFDKKSAFDRLNRKVGMDSLKEICRKYIALEKEKKRNGLAKTARTHMIFYGKPGTGKTTGAIELAKVMAENGIGNGKFIVATRKDLLGEYVGHTAPLVAKKFEEAKGGILFVDEAGFFNQVESGGFVNEALKEFIRYMEINDEVTVIFSMYPKEVKLFLKNDVGMTSRIAHFVKFDDYDSKQLSKITYEMMADRGYYMPKNAAMSFENYYDALRKGLKERFGNARECRRLIDELVLEISLRNFEKTIKNPNNISLMEIDSILSKQLSKNLDTKPEFGFFVSFDEKTKVNCKTI